MSNAARSAALLTLVSLGNSALSLVVDAVVAAQFGAGPRLDAYFTAQVIPGILGATLPGALAVVFVPLFLRVRQEAGEQRAWTVTSNVLNLMLLGLGAAALPFFIAPQWFLARLAPGFDRETLSLAATLLRWLLAGALLGASCVLLGGLHNALRLFMIPALLPLLQNLVNLAFVFGAAPRLGIVALAAASLVGATLQASALARLLARPGRYYRTVSLQDPYVRESLQLAVLLFLGSLAYNALALSDRYFASTLPPGSLTQLIYAVRVGMFFSNLVSTSVGTVALTALSGHAAAGRADLLGVGTGKASSVIGLALLPALATLLALREPLLALLLERKAFTAEAIRETASLMPYYLGLFLALAIGRPINMALFALRDTRTPFLLNSGVLLAYVPLSWVLTVHAGLGARGIALAGGGAHLLLLVGVAVTLRVRVPEFPLTSLCRYLIKLGTISAVLFAACGWVSSLLRSGLAGWPPLGQRVTVLVSGAVLYTATMAILFLTRDATLRAALHSFPLTRRFAR